MTKQEYKNLLESDYWKGFSFSIIKERNFTCEDCGACYPGERNKLQVHHLVYRDINPWSYAPDEMVVLCRSCHEKRHGIIHPQKNPFEGEENEEKLSELDVTPWNKIKHIFALLGREIPNVCSKKNNKPNHYFYRGKRRRKRKLKSRNWLFIISLLLIFGGGLSRVYRRDAKHPEVSSSGYEFMKKTSSKKSKHKEKKLEKIETKTEVDSLSKLVSPENVEPDIVEESNTESNDAPVTSNSTNEEPFIE